jgi:hypothetical protein
MAQPAAARWAAAILICRWCAATRWCGRTSRGWGGVAEGARDAPRSRRGYNGGDGGRDNAARAAYGDRRREALYEVQMVLEAVAGDAARSDAQEPPSHEGRGARRQAPVQEGRAPDEGAARQGARLEGAHVRPFERGISEAPGGACQGPGVPAGGALACEEQGLDAAEAEVPAERDSREQAAGAVREAVGAVCRAQDGWGRIYGGVRGRERHLDGRHGVHSVSGGSAALNDAQGLAAEEAKVGVQCDEMDGATAAVVAGAAGLTECNGDARRRFLPWNGIKM